MDRHAPCEPVVCQQLVAGPPTQAAHTQRARPRRPLRLRRRREDSAFGARAWSSTDIVDSLIAGTFGSVMSIVQLPEFSAVRCAYRRARRQRSARGVPRSP